MMKFSPIVIVAPLLIGGALWVMAARKKEEKEPAAPGVPGVPSAPSPPTETPPTPPGVPSTPTATSPPADIGKYVLQAVASGAPDYMRQAAHALEAWGYTDQANDLRTVANEEQAAEEAAAQGERETETILTRTPGIAETLPRTETTVRPTVPTTLPSGITIPVPAPVALPPGTEQVDLPPVVPVSQPGRTVADPMDVARANLAKRTADHLRTATKYNEDKALVGAFQTQEITLGWSGKSDGLYGPSTARRFARYGIVPPNPLYWPSSGATQAKAEYGAWLLSQAAGSSDPAAWAAAAAAVH